jgi:signal transduction histidine kinase/HAMP domain-containing protein/ActR/RegA family two-component response regulator
MSADHENPASGLYQLLAGLVAVRSGDFSRRLPDDADPLMNEIASVFNGMNDQLALFTSEVTRVAREVGTEGNLGGQASLPEAVGTWRDMTDSVNAMAGNLTNQVRNIAQVATAVATGDLSQRITVTAQGEILELKNTLNTMVDQLSSFADEVTRVAREVGTEGRLGGQADVQGVSGTWKDLTESVNVMAANLTAQVRAIATVTTAVARGDLSQTIRVDARGEILELKDTINTMVEQLSAVANEVTGVARQVGTQGNLGGQATVRGVSGTWKDLTENVNVMASNLTAQVRSISQVATAVAHGDLSQKINVEAKGEVAALADVLNGMVDTLSAFAGEVTRVAHEVGTEGILGGQAKVPHVAGTWKDLTDSVNGMANNLTSQVRNIAQVTTAVAQGDLSTKIDVDARGEILALKMTINTMVDQLSSFAGEVTRVAREVGSEGRLGGQAEVEGVSGTWKRLTEHVNELAGNLTRQVRAIAEVTSAVATGDLTRSITVEAQGEVAELKDNINAMVQSLRHSTKANQEQEWLQTNLARIAGLLQGQRDVGTVAELIMDELVPLAGAQHGTFFLADSADRTRLRLIAGYGLREDIDCPDQFRLGQSLIGQAAKTRKPIVVADLPDGYVRISSGLGDAPPANLIVLPIVADHQLLGVIEAASFSLFTQVQREFLEQLVETIGVTVNSILVNARTEELLAESQRLAAELQSRQDDLQRTNADLEDNAAQLARQKHDIELKNEQIEQARQEIEERASQLDLASRYKSQFLANMSHELRTPLNSLLVLARLLTQNPDGNLTPKQVEYATVIHSSGSDLLQLINDILDLSKVEAGKMEVHPESFPLARLVEELDAVFMPLMAEKGIDFAVTADLDVPSVLYADKQRLRQILHNLVSNALKFTDNGSVSLRVALAGRQPAHGRLTLEFSVTDTGIGIAEENLGTIFGAFAQGETSAGSSYGGTGLVLAICREVAAALGGRITVQSKHGQGSTFSLYLPVADTEKTPETAVDDPVVPATYGAWSVAGTPPAQPDPSTAMGGPHESLRGKRVLVVDDDPRNVFALTSVLELYGVSVTHAADGQQGLEVLRRGGIDLVLLDVMMPNLDGYATVSAIRSVPELADLPVIAVTARAMQEDRAKSIAAGASDYITKPVDTEALLARMEKWLLTPRRTQPAVGSPETSRVPD